jgi:hypothetical protein
MNTDICPLNIEDACGEGCAWYDKTMRQCAIHTVNDNLAEIANKLNKLVSMNLR